MSVDDSENWTRLEQKFAFDPHYVDLYQREKRVNPPIEPKLTKPKFSSHLWMGKLPAGIEPGTHLLRVKTTDMHGRTFFAHRSFRVMGDLKPKVVNN